MRVARLLPRSPHTLSDPVEARKALRLGQSGRRPRHESANAPRAAAAGSARGSIRPDFAALPSSSLYLLVDEWAAEIAPRTMQG